jgi:hypothetical protein
LEELREEESHIDVGGEIIRNLAHYVLELSINERKVPITSPLVGKELFQFLLEANVYVSSPVKLFQDSNKFRELITLVQIGVKILEIVKDFNEVSHNVGKHGDSKQHSC